MNFDIIEIFTRAGKITWKYKILWLFGMLASCGRSSGGNGGNSNSGGSDFNGDNPFSPQMLNQMERFFLRVGRWFEENPWIIFVAIALIILLVIIQVFCAYVGMAGLARGVVHAENGVETLHFGELFSESLTYFWRLFGSSLLIFLPVFLFFFIFIFVAAFSADGIGSEEAFAGFFGILMFAMCCCFFPIMIFLGVYSQVVSRSIIIEDMGVFAALSRAWQVLIKNIIGYIVVGIILFIAAAIIGILISLPALLAVLPVLGSLISGQINSWQPFILAGVILLCYSPIAWFLNGVLTTYTESVWSLMYLRITQSTINNNTPVSSETNA